jgi:hypothetical protein
MDEGLLHRVFRQMSVPEDQPCDREQPVTRTDRECPESIVIAALRCLDESTIHVWILRRRPTWSPEPYDAPVRRTVQDSRYRIEESEASELAERGPEAPR